MRREASPLPPSFGPRQVILTVLLAHSAYALFLFSVAAMFLQSRVWDYATRPALLTGGWAFGLIAIYIWKPSYPVAITAGLFTVGFWAYFYAG
jgi:hypothetical protein